MIYLFQKLVQRIELKSVVIKFGLKMDAIQVMTNLHYYSKTLGTSGRAYELRSGSDQKCLAESGAIIDAAFDHLARSDTRAVLLAGDLTNDGVKWCATGSCGRSCTPWQRKSRCT